MNTDRSLATRSIVILAICCLSVLIVAMDVTIVNVALPSIQRQLHTTTGGLQWTVDAYALVLACLFMLSGSLADRFGRRRIFLLGLVIFSAGSLLCSVAPTVGFLIAFRAMQAIGGSMLNPVALAIIVNTFPEPKDRARALGVWGGVVGIGWALGPILGGVLVSGIGWRSVFWINIPLGVVAIVLAQLFLPESKPAHARRLDPPAQLLILAALATLVYAIIDAPHSGWASTSNVTLYAVSAVAFLTFVLVERRRHEPLIDVRFFRSAPFSGAIAIAIASFAALGGYLFLSTLYLQDLRHYSPLHAGLLTAPMALGLLIFAPISGRLVASSGPRLPFIFAGPFMAFGAFLMERLGLHSSTLQLLMAYTFFGIGFGLVNAPISNGAVSGMPREQAGVAGGVGYTGRQIGSSLGVAVTGSLVAGSSPHFLANSHAAWFVVTGCGIAVIVIGVATNGPWGRATARRTEAMFEKEVSTSSIG